MPNTMRKFPKIFVAINGYQPSIDVADYAIKIAKKDISELIALAVLNVSTPRRLSSPFITA